MTRPVAACVAAVVALLVCGCESPDTDGDSARGPIPAVSSGGEAPGGSRTSPLRAPGPPGASEPRLIVAPAFIDMGPLKRRSARTVTTVLRNEGTSDLIVDRTEIACRCFTASLDRRRMAPGESATLTVTVKTMAHRGEMSDRIGIVSNDPAGVRTFDLRFEVPDDLAPDPADLYLGWVAPGATAAGRARVKNRTGTDARLLYAACISPDLSDGELTGTVVRAPARDGSPGEVEVSFSAPARPGTHRRTLAIATEDPSNPTVHLPVIVSVSRTAAVSPDRLDFGRFASGQRPARLLEVALDEGGAIAHLTARPGVLAVTASEPRPAGRKSLVQVSATVRPDAPFGPFHGELVVQILGGETATLVLPFEGYVEEVAGGDGRPGSR